MLPFAIVNLLAMGQPPSGTREYPTAQMLNMLVMLAFFAVVMYVLMIRPQQKKAKEQAAMLKAIKPGDKVLTSGGLLGVVVSVKEKSITLRSADAKLEVVKSAVTEIVEKAPGES